MYRKDKQHLRVFIPLCHECPFNIHRLAWNTYICMLLAIKYKYFVCMFKVLTAQRRSLTQQPVVAIRTALKPSLGTVFYQHHVQGSRQGRQRKGQL